VPDVKGHVFRRGLPSSLKKGNSEVVIVQRPVDVFEPTSARHFKGGKGGGQILYRRQKWGQRKRFNNRSLTGFVKKEPKNQGGRSGVTLLSISGRWGREEHPTLRDIGRAPQKSKKRGNQNRYMVPQKLMSEKKGG